MRGTEVESHDAVESVSAAAVLAKAALRAGAWLGLSDSELCSALQIERLDAPLQAGSPSWYGALGLIQLALRLERLLGTADAARRWMRGPNMGLRRPPIEILVEPGGPMTLVDYTHGFTR